MSLNRTAKGIVLVPCLLLGAAFISAGVWGGETNQTVAYSLGGALTLGGILAQLLPDGSNKPDVEDNN
ncbi:MULTISPECIES: GIVxVP protein [unclassified Synechococcus]|jgi:hypothetical protein|uniref:GIVxVP protein n=1 Tax=unclassified Synechococcus TaxID=2626047 RepID=UPI0020CF2E20|nr:MULTISPECIES: GIVxVP protein [unclassified Synechococcus]MCP9939120.1 hypothetical protein [Synechococcus sp. Cruz CV12-2-Slac-r]MCX5928177.1 GIVxVP protein [Synechococcus sp. LacPavin_0920_WC12_MAG_50_7]MDA0290382.1 GIVxVP protein [Cyanobacteriota bacterium]MDA1170266.1 GIVxVP protein [Cyanobacteriota bacterium]